MMRWNKVYVMRKAAERKCNEKTAWLYRVNSRQSHGKSDN